jgi:hypothetical protein
MVQDRHGPGKKAYFKVRSEAKRVIAKAKAIETEFRQNVGKGRYER